MRIRVTALDIERGIKGDVAQCPVARAIRRATNWHVTPEVGYNIVALKSASGQEFETRLPQVANDFINIFDKSVSGYFALLVGAVKPFSFQIRKPVFKLGRPAW